jgi:hypothetical protein
MTRLITASLCAIATLCAGCAAGTAGPIGAAATPAFDARFGESVRQAQARQTINPDAGRQSDPVVGIDGRAGATAIDRYQDSFKAPSRSFDVLNIGAGDK